MTGSPSARIGTPVTRREFLGTAAAAVVCAAGTGQAAGGAPRFAYVGSFTSEARKARGEGISVYRLDPESGRWGRVQALDKEVNPGYLAVNPKRPVLYAVHADVNQVSAFAINDTTGALTLINRQSSGGDNPVHLSLDPSGRWLVVANYASGNVVVLPVGADGSLGPRSDDVALKGEPGPHRTEQSVPHPHQCPFDPAGRLVVVPDKGLDRLFVFRLDATRGKLVAAEPPSVKTRSGAGPRHIAFHPRLPYAFVINELDSSVASYRISEAGALEPLQVQPSIPSSFVGDSTGAAVDVAPSGRFVYVSNRGHDSVGIFRIGESNGVLTPVGWEPTKGPTPRFIGLDPTGARLYAANQRGDAIVEFTVNAASGLLTATGRIVVAGTPVCVVWR